MFPNQVPGFTPNVGPTPFNPGVMPAAAADSQQSAARLVPPVQLGDIYQAAKARAVEDIELDHLFNAEYYGDSI